METRVTSVLVVVFLVGLFAGFTHTAAFGQVGTLPTIVLTGTVYPPDKEVTGGITTVKLFVGEKEWNFNITKFMDMEDPEKTGLDFADSLGERLELRSEIEGVLAPLENPDAAGKTIKIRGIYDEAARMINVESLTMENEMQK